MTQKSFKISTSFIDIYITRTDIYRESRNIHMQLWLVALLLQSSSTDCAEILRCFRTCQHRHSQNAQLMLVNETIIIPKLPKSHSYSLVWSARSPFNWGYSWGVFLEKEKTLNINKVHSLTVCFYQTTAFGLLLNPNKNGDGLDSFCHNAATLRVRLLWKY